MFIIMAMAVLDYNENMNSEILKSNIIIITASILLMFVTLFILGASKKMNADRSGDMIKKLMENTQQQPQSVAEENKAAIYDLATTHLKSHLDNKLQAKFPGMANTGNVGSPEPTK